MRMDDFSDYDGVALAEMVRRGDVTPLELTEAAIARAERHNPKLNAIVYSGFDEARVASKGDLPDGPFRGVPFLIKDLGMPVAGWPRTSGSRFARNVVDQADGGLTARYRAAGMVFLGKTNTPEYGITGTTESALLGPCRNPWNADHIAGGSSGGSASAVAAGIVPMAHASDGLGSIRIPAACCGLVGLKVTRDRNPNLPDAYDYVIGQVVDHVVSRTVRDSAAMLDWTGRPEVGQPYATPAKDRPYVEEITRPPGRLRITWSAETANGRPIEPEIEAALQRTAELLSRLGHDVRPQGLGVDLRPLYAARGPMNAANFAAGMAKLIEEIGHEPEPDELEGLTWASMKGGRKVSGPDALRSLHDTRRLARQVVAAFEDIDVHVTPVLGTPVPEIGYLSPVLHEPREVNKRQGRVFPFTPPFNFSGQPSLSLPLETDSAGLPIGIMFTAKYADEATLFRLAAQLEKEVPWIGRKPPVWN